MNNKKQEFMHPLWSGSIGFGLVNIPVRMHAATEESTLSFNQLDKTNNSRIKYKKVNELTGEAVKEQDIVRGYKMGQQYIMVTNEDFKRATPEKIDHLEIVQFVEEKEVDAVYFEKPYYLEPDKAGAKAYALLRDAMKKEGKAALGAMVFHEREWVCLIKAMGDYLVLHRLRFHEEIRTGEQLFTPEEKLSTEELKAATEIITKLTKPFKPEQFRDVYADKLLQVIQAKSKGKKIEESKALKVVHNNTTTQDLMAKLKESLNPKTKRAS